MTPAELADYRESIADCGCDAVGFCDAWGCAAVARLLAEIDRLRAAMTEAANSAGRDWLAQHLKLAAALHGTEAPS
jgi:hypothetical protein